MKQLAAVWLFSFLLLFSVLPQGSLTPPAGPPLPTMKTLDQPLGQFVFLIHNRQICAGLLTR